MVGSVATISSSSVPPLSFDCPHSLQAPQTHKTATVDSLTTGTTCHHGAPFAPILVSVHHTTPDELVHSDPHRRPLHPDPERSPNLL